MNKKTVSILTTLLVVSFVASLFPSVLFQTTLAATQQEENVFSIMQISDTQHLPIVSPTLYSDTASWIVSNSASNNLKMVVATGDMIDDRAGQAGPVYNASKRAEEWAIANASLGKLLDAGIPYCWGAGNHDQVPFANASGTTDWNSFLAFNAPYMRTKSYWVSDIYNSKNTAVKFTVNDYTFLIVNLEFVANSSALAWMKRLLDGNPSANVIVTTHSYLTPKADYNSSNAAVAAWQNALKTTLDNYPNVFLALCGHVYTATTSANMTRVGGREEILFDRQEENNQTGAASVRIYTFNLTSKKVSATTYAVDKQTWLTDSYSQFTFDASITSDWTLTTDARALKAYPDLKEYIWQKDARMPPNGQYDKIGLHRLVKTGITPKGVVFLTNCPTWGTGEQRISNPANDSWTKYENFSQAIYWANRGFDVYAIDYRTHFVPKTMNTSQMSFAANWGLDVWVSDIKEAAEKVKTVSGAAKFFISGECTGGMAALNYATKYWRTDLKGIILLDANFFSPGYPIVGRINETNTVNLTSTVNAMNAAGTWAYNPYGTLAPIAAYALQNPGAPAEYPPGTPLGNATNPLTNKTWTNITEWFTTGVQYNFGTVSASSPQGMYSNLTGGYNNISQLEYCFSNTEFLPYRIQLEAAAMVNWVNCPYLTYDYNDHYNEIGVPVIAFEAGLFANRTGTLRFVNGINSTLTGVMLKNYGHTDLFFGTYSARDVSQPALAWMLNELGLTPRATAFSNATVITGWTWNFFVHSTAGTGPYSYQWYEGTTLMAGQTKMVLPVTKNTPGTYTYYCKVTDANGATVNSNSVTLTVFS